MGTLEMGIEKEGRTYEHVKIIVDKLGEYGCEITYLNIRLKEGGL